MTRPFKIDKSLRERRRIIRLLDYLKRDDLTGEQMERIGKRTDLDEYRDQSRGGKGIITIKTTERNGSVVNVMQVADDNDLMVITDNGKILRVPVSGFSVIGRNTQGVRLITTEEKEKVVAVAKLAEKEEDELDEEEEGLDAIGDGMADTGE